MTIHRTRRAFAVVALGCVAILSCFRTGYADETRWISELESADWKLVDEALGSLVSMRSTKAIPALLNGAVGASESDVETAAERYLSFRAALAELVDLRHANLLLDSLESDREGRRRIAIDVLGDIAWRIEFAGGEQVLQSAMDRMLALYGDGRRPEGFAIFESVPRFGEVALRLARDDLARLAKLPVEAQRVSIDLEFTISERIVQWVGPFAKSCRPHIRELFGNANQVVWLARRVGVDVGSWIREEMNSLVRVAEEFEGPRHWGRPEWEALVEAYQRLTFPLVLSPEPHQIVRDVERPFAPYAGNPSATTSIVIRYLRFAEDKVSAIREALLSKVERRGAFYYLRSHSEFVASVEEELLDAWLEFDRNFERSAFEGLLRLTHEATRERVLLRVLKSGKPVHISRALKLLATMESSSATCFELFAERFLRAAELDSVYPVHLVLVSKLGRRGMPLVSGLERIIAQSENEEVKFAARVAKSLVEEQPSETSFFAQALSQHDLDPNLFEILQMFCGFVGPHSGVLIERVMDGEGGLSYWPFLESLDMRVIDRLVELAERDDRFSHDWAFGLFDTLELSLDAVPKLSDLLRHDDAEIRLVAAIKLASVAEHHREGVLRSVDQVALESVLRENLSSEWQPLQFRVCVALPHFGEWGRRLETDVLGLLHESEDKFIPIRALVGMNAERSLCGLVGKVTLVKRGSALWFLSDVANLTEDAITRIRGMLRSSDWNTRRIAGFCLLSRGLDPNGEASRAVAGVLQGRVRIACFLNS